MTLEELDELQQKYKIPEVSVDILEDQYCFVSAKEKDNARYLLITVTEYGIPKVFSYEKNPVFVYTRVRKPDGNAVFDTCSLLPDGRVLVHLTEQILAVAGCAEMDLLFSEHVLTKLADVKDEYTICSTKNIHLDITPMPYSPDTMIEFYDSAQIGVVTTAEKGTANGVASLDENCKIPLTQIPYQEFLDKLENGNENMGAIVLTLTE